MFGDPQRCPQRRSRAKTARPPSRRRPYSASEHARGADADDRTRAPDQRSGEQRGSPPAGPGERARRRPAERVGVRNDPQVVDAARRTGRVGAGRCGRPLRAYERARGSRTSRRRGSRRRRSSRRSHPERARPITAGRGRDQTARGVPPGVPRQGPEEVLWHDRVVVCNAAANAASPASEYRTSSSAMTIRS